MRVHRPIEGCQMAGNHEGPALAKSTRGPSTCLMRPVKKQIIWAGVLCPSVVFVGELCDALVRTWTQSRAGFSLGWTAVPNSYVTSTGSKSAHPHRSAQLGTCVHSTTGSTCISLEDHALKSPSYSSYSYYRYNDNKCNKKRKFKSTMSK